MPGRVPLMAPYASVSKVQGSLLVGASEWLDSAYAANWLLGRGGMLVPTYAPAITIPNGTSADLRYRTKPRYQAVQRLWGVLLRSDADLTDASVSISVNGGPAADYNVQRTRDVVQPLLHLETLSAQSSAEQDLVLSITANDNDVVLDGVSCVEIPRATLALGGSDGGVDVTTIRQRAPIYDGSTGRSLGEVINAVVAARDVARRVSLIQWALPATTTFARAFTNANFTDAGGSLWLQGIPALERALYVGATTGTVSWRVYAFCSDGTTAGEVRVNTTSGGAGAATITIGAGVANGAGNAAWFPATGGAAASFTVDAEDLSTADGRRAATWDEVQVQVRRTAGAGTIYLASSSMWCA